MSNLISSINVLKQEKFTLNSPPTLQTEKNTKTDTTYNLLDCWLLKLDNSYNTPFISFYVIILDQKELYVALVL